MYGTRVVINPLEAVEAEQKSKFTIEPELRIALVGKTGVGKSATANTICGEEYFVSGVQAVSSTQICQQKKTKVLGRDVLVIDTPGIPLFETETDHAVVKNEIKRCVNIGAPGLHAVLFVMEIGRFRQEDSDVITTFLTFFESEMRDRMIVVFTHGDKLLKKNIKLEEYLEAVPNNLKYFLEDCQNRCILFNNEFNKEESYEQINGLLMMVEAMKRSKEIAYYSDALFVKAEEGIKVREREIEEKMRQKYMERLTEFEIEIKRQVEDHMRKEKEKERKDMKDEYEDKLEKVRDDIRKEFSDKKSSCGIL